MDSFVSFVHWKTLANPSPRSRLNNWHRFITWRANISNISSHRLENKFSSQLNFSQGFLIYGMNSRSKGDQRCSRFSTWIEKTHWACSAIIFQVLSGISKVQTNKKMVCFKTHLKKKSCEIFEEIVRLFKHFANGILSSRLADKEACTIKLWQAQRLSGSGRLWEWDYVGAYHLSE